MHCTSPASRSRRLRPHVTQGVPGPEAIPAEERRLVHGLAIGVSESDERWLPWGRWGEGGARSLLLPGGAWGCSLVRDSPERAALLPGNPLKRVSISVRGPNCRLSSRRQKRLPGVPGGRMSWRAWDLAGPSPLRGWRVPGQGAPGQAHRGGGSDSLAGASQGIRDTNLVVCFTTS